MTMPPTATVIAPSAPRVTILALCFNHARFLAECLNSIQAQTCQDFELLISDDASSDASADLIRAWVKANRPGTVFIHHAKNKGLCPTLTELMGLARGQYISMVSTDDVWEPGRLQTLLAAIEARPEVAVAYSDASQIDETGQQLAESFLQAHGYRHKPAPTGKVFSALADGNFLPAMSTIIRRSAIDAVGGYDEQLSYEDYDMWLRLASRDDFLFVPGLLARYRIVSTSMVRTLFECPSPHHLRTLIKIVDKWRDSGELTCAQRRRWLQRRIEAAYGLFFHNQGDAGRELLSGAIRTRQPYWLMLGAAAFLGLRRQHLNWLRSRQSPNA